MDSKRNEIKLPNAYKSISLLDVIDVVEDTVEVKMKDKCLGEALSAILMSFDGENIEGYVETPDAIWAMQFPDYLSMVHDVDFLDMVEVFLEVFTDDFSVVGNSFESFLNNLRQVLKRCKETNLVLNWDKCHFMVDEGIFLGQKISKKGIEVDRPKTKVISKLPPPTLVKGVRSFWSMPISIGNLSKTSQRLRVPSATSL
uniref:Reverse transcriptase domain-containing protein n=1 Tax=Nicotiana tabacum TaxID=4097 RepID=A0A1S3Y4I1_TOBAC|nr:PREDICTED: uncharacterized protein LOC107772161 [Nicotiana tabacum]